MARSHIATSAFEELGFSAKESLSLRIRSELMIALQEHLAHVGGTQTEMAVMLGVSQPRISNLMAGRLHLFSVDTLLDLIERAGLVVAVSVAAPSTSRKHVPVAKAIKPIQAKRKDGRSISTKATTKTSGAKAARSSTHG